MSCTGCFSFWGTPEEWFGMLEGIILTIMAQLAWKANQWRWKTTKPEVKP